MTPGLEFGACHRKQLEGVLTPGVDLKNLNEGSKMAARVRKAGIEHFIFVTGRNKGVIEDHFDRQFELEEVLAARGKTSELERLNDHLPGPGTTSFTRQQEPLGLGHAVWCARELVGSEPFALLLPDVLVQTPGKGCLAQMLEVYAKYGGNIIAVDPVPEDQVKNYGVV